MPSRTSGSQSQPSRNCPSLRSRGLRQDRFSYPPRLGAPYILVHLELEPDVEFVCKDPFRELNRLQLSKNNGHQNRAPPVDSMTLNNPLRPVVILAVADHEFDLVRPFEIIHIPPV